MNNYVIRDSFGRLVDLDTLEELLGGLQWMIKKTHVHIAGNPTNTCGWYLTVHNYTAQPLEEIYNYIKNNITEYKIEIHEAHILIIIKKVKEITYG